MNANQPTPYCGLLPTRMPHRWRMARVGVLSAVLLVAGCPGGADHAEAVDPAREEGAEEEAADLGEDLIDSPGDASTAAQPPSMLDEPEPAEEDGVLWAPISLDEQRHLRDGFRWEGTHWLSEASATSYEVDGEQVELPPMHYALVYLETRDQLHELEALGIHYDFAPLFDAEWPDDEEHSLTLPFEGDPEDRGAQFVFALMPSPVYNAIRLEALAGESTFRAVILREVPTEARAADGTVSWDYLLENLTEYAPASTDAEAGADDGVALDDDGLAVDGGAAVDTASDGATDTDKRLGRRLRKWARRVAKAAKRVTNGIRKVIGKIALAVLPDTRITIKTHVQPRSNVPMTRAWDDGRGGYGQPLMLKGLYVALSGQSRLTLYKGRLDSRGEVTIAVPRSLRVNVCFEADTPAATMEMGLFRATRHCWPRHRPRGTSDTIERNIGETEFYSLALMVDAYEYARTVLGYTPPKATVQVGWVADKLSQDGRASVPCLAAPKAAVWMANLYSDALNGAAAIASGVTGGAIPFLPLGTIAEFAMTTDIMMPKASQRSRNVAVHEYGHFVFCTLLDKTSHNTFSRVWSQVMSPKNLVGARDSAAVALNEGFADWFSSQASGSVNYFTLLASGDLEQSGRGSFFLESGAPAAGRGMEENIGGPMCTSSKLPGCGVSTGLEVPAYPVATVATILHDAIDRDSCGSSSGCQDDRRSDGAAWVLPPANTNAPFTAESPFAIADVGDETIALAPRHIKTAIEEFARSGPGIGAKLTYKAFFNALTKVMRDEGYGDAEICNLFALHRPDGRCPRSWTDISDLPLITVSTTVVPENAGDITGSGLGDARCTGAECTLTVGGSLALSAAPRRDFVFEGWSGCSAATTADVQLKTLTESTSCTARFHPNKVSVSFGTSGAGRVTSSRPSCTAAACTLAYGQALTLTATPDVDWEFAGWSGCSSATTPSITIDRVTADQTCTARFVRPTYTVSAQASAGGSVSPASTSVPRGGSVTLEAIPAQGYRFSHYSGSAPCTGSRARLALTSVRGPLSCTANFVRVHSVSWVVDANSTALAEPGVGALCYGTSCNVDAGGNVTLRMSARSGLLLDGWRCTNAVSGQVLSTWGTANPGVVSLSNVAADWRCQTSSSPYLR